MTGKEILRHVLDVADLHEASGDCEEEAGSEAKGDKAVAPDDAADGVCDRFQVLEGG